ncbi:MAG: hypothetical protein HY204_04210 [Nitrospirae bacterium]|nr:hypothetical protein [Nitrospirota bacterium]
MSRGQYLLMLMLTATAGMIGGAVSGRFFMGEPAWAQKTIPHEKVIAAEKFLLVDSDGRTRAKLGLWPNGRPGFFAYDKDGIPNTSLNLQTDDPRLVLIDKNGKVIWSAP